MKPTFDFVRYNPRDPPKDATMAMKIKMVENCSSDEQYLLAATSRSCVTNLTQLSSAYSPGDYEKLPCAKFEPSATVFFLTGGTRSAASRILFEELLKVELKEGQKKKSKRREKRTNRDQPSRSTPLFKAANWVVQLYDFGM